MMYTRKIFSSLNDDVIVTIMNLNHDGDEYIVKKKLNGNKYETVLTTYCRESALSKAKEENEKIHTNYGCN